MYLAPPPPPGAERRRRQFLGWATGLYVAAVGVACAWWWVLGADDPDRKPGWVGSLALGVLGWAGVMLWQAHRGRLTRTWLVCDGAGSAAAFALYVLLDAGGAAGRVAGWLLLPVLLLALVVLQRWPRRR